MLSKSDRPVAPVLTRLGSAGFVVAPLVPTATGLGKAILDATRPIREMLLHAGLHDFTGQAQGPEGKVELQTFIVREHGVEATSMSLYRPITKHGDPRLWIRGLPGYAEPWNLLCLIPHGKSVYVVNASTPGLLDKALAPGGVLHGLSVTAPASELMELLTHLKAIAAKGWIPAHVVGPTAVGMVLERELGITPNAEEKPDYLGFEVKGRRLRPSGADSGSLQTLFGKTPVWALGVHGGGRALLDAHGYLSGGILRLACTVSATPNPQGLSTVLDEPKAEVHVISSTSSHTCMVWPLARLQDKLAEKHRATAWVDVETRPRSDGYEEFWLKRVEFSAAPAVHILGTLVAEGIVTVDLTIRESGPTTVRDHGYLFRMERVNLPALFPAPMVAHDLRLAT